MHTHNPVVFCYLVLALIVYTHSFMENVINSANFPSWYVDRAIIFSVCDIVKFILCMHSIYLQSFL